MTEEPWPDFFVVLTGGLGSRLGGADKAALEVDGATLLERALALCADSPVVVAGPDTLPRQPARVRSRILRAVQEEPPHGGPAAGLAAGVGAVADTPPRVPGPVGQVRLVGVWAVDQAGVVANTWRRLAAAVGMGAPDTRGGAVLTRDGRRQYGVGVYPLADLVRACTARRSWHGAPLRSLLDPVIAAEVPASNTEARDIDTLDDLEWWRRRSTRPEDADPAPSTREGTRDDDADR